MAGRNGIIAAKRVLSLTLCLCMVLAMLPVDALAAERLDIAEDYASQQESSGGY